MVKKIAPAIFLFSFYNLLIALLWIPVLFFPVSNDVCGLIYAFFIFAVIFFIDDLVEDYYPVETTSKDRKIILLLSIFVSIALAFVLYMMIQ